jgi:hypothetical protein
MLVISQSTEVADIYFTEFARIFNHFYARWWAAQLAARDGDPQAKSFLEETPAWQKPYFRAGNPRYFQRTIYSAGVAANDAT